MSFWSKIEEGRPFAADLRTAERKPSKRVRVIRTSRWSNYEGYIPGRGRPRCQAKGCDKYLRRDQRFACCADHEKQVRALFDTLKQLMEPEAA